LPDGVPTLGISMRRCGYCGQDNADDASFCENCGTKLVAAGPRPAPPRDFGSSAAVAGQRAGEAVTQMGRTWGEEAGKIGRGMWTWWDEVLGPFAPVAAGLIGVVVLLIAVFALEAATSGTEHEDFWKDVVSFVERHLWVFIGLIFLNSFSSFFHRQYRKSWRWALPVVAALGCVGGFWILLELLRIYSADFGHPLLGDLAWLAELLLPVLFLLVLVISYLMIFWITIGERGSEPPRYGKYGRIR